MKNTIKTTAVLLLAAMFTLTGCKKEEPINDSGNDQEDVYEYLCFTAEEDSATIKIRLTNDTDSVPNFQYSYDGKTWCDYVLNNTVVTLDKIGDKVYFIGDNPNGFNHPADYSYIKFEIYDKKVAASGNIMSLIDPTCETNALPCRSCFYGLFYKAKITAPPVLPATTLTDHCYAQMFSDCYELKTAPELPATTLADYCYANMFVRCYELKTAPKLPATTLATDCYTYMFERCSGLTIPPELPATTLAIGCYHSMFENSAITEAPDLPATVLADCCYIQMFYLCKNLKVPPVLPATTMTSSCYAAMFGKSAITYAPELPATTLADGCYNSMFYHCDSLTTAPELPATTSLPRWCYEEMFKDCNKLNSIKVHLTEWRDGYGFATSSWLENVAPNGTFYCPGSLPKVFDSSHIPSGWTVETF